MNTSLPNSPGVVAKPTMTILAAIEDGGTVEHVLAMAVGHARAWPQSHLHLASVIDLPAIAAAAFVRETKTFAPAAESERAEHAVLERHAKSAREALGAEVTTHLLVGPIVSELTQLAREIQADLLIVGTHDAGPFKRLLFGSVASPLVHHAPCSVLLVRAKQLPESSPRAGNEFMCSDCLRAQGDSFGSVPRCERHALHVGLAAPGETSP